MLCPAQGEHPLLPAQHQGLDRPWVRHQACRHLASQGGQRGPLAQRPQLFRGRKEAK